MEDRHPEARLERYQQEEGGELSVRHEELCAQFRRWIEIGERSNVDLGSSYRSAAPAGINECWLDVPIVARRVSGSRHLLTFFPDLGIPETCLDHVQVVVLKDLFGSKVREGIVVLVGYPLVSLLVQRDVIGWNIVRTGRNSNFIKKLSFYVEYEF